MKNKKFILILIVLLTIINVFLVFKKDTSIVEKSKVSKIERKEFNIYLQKTVGSKDYDPSTDTTFPTSGYLLNTTKTMCYGYNGNKLNSNPVIQELTDGVINGSITINSSKTIYCDLYFDKNETPTINTFNVTGKTSGGTTLNNSFTYQTDKLPFTVTYTDNESDVKQYCINETNSIENCNWQTLSETNSYSLKDNKDGEKTMYIYLKDKANNVSVTTDKSTTKITVDQTKPKITSFTLTGAADEGQTLSNPSTYTHKTGITYNATITESNIDSYCVYEDSCSYETTSSTTLNTSYTLKDTEGSHSVKIKVKDKAGNESDVSTQSIKLDLNNPTATISKNTQDTSSITVTVSGTDTTPNSSIIERQCRESGGSWVTASNSNGSCKISNLSDGKEYTIEGRVRDASGRWNTTYPSVSVTTESAGFKGNGKQLIEYKPKGLTPADVGGMRRFVGKCNAADGSCTNVVDNFVCFGYTTESDCALPVSDNNYLYRIIGITSDGKIKLIMNNGLNDRQYQWSTGLKSTTKWPDSLIFSAINGGDFLTGLNGGWQSKITEESWLYGDMGYNGTKYLTNNTADEIYRIESGKAESYSGKKMYGGYSVDKWTDRVSAKIGLLYLSDFYYSYSGSTTTNCFEMSRCEGGWLNGHFSQINVEWSIVYFGVGSDGSPGPICIGNDICLMGSYANTNTFYVRPVFYLSAETLISSGSGTSSDPFIIDLCDGNPSCNRNPGVSGSTD